MYKKSTPQATALKEELEKRGIIVEAEKWDGHKHIDLTISRAHLNIEVDGKQHWEDSQQIVSDLNREHYSDEKGWRTIHVPNVLIDSIEDLPRIADALVKVARIRAHFHGYRFPYHHYQRNSGD